MSIQFTKSEQIEQLNDQCFCLPAQSDRLQGMLTAQLQDMMDTGALDPNFNPFSDAAVFLSVQDYNSMCALIKAMETVKQLPKYKKQIYDRQPNLMKDVQSNTNGLLIGYDFHITTDGPRLIEINTNAGGAFITKMLTGQALENLNCCKTDLSASKSESLINDALYQIFLNEWQLARPSQLLKTVAIVDENVKQQYLYTDMLLAAKLLTLKGVDAFVCDVNELRFESGAVFYQNKKIDMTYNRLTDFMLESNTSKPLRLAYEQDQIVLSPAPIHHALYADKRNLALLSDKAQLIDWGVDKTICNALSLVPKTCQMSTANSETWWRARKKYFFKPHSGFGSRRAYRGDKLTKKVWGEIKSAGFIVQKYIPPSTRNTETNGHQKRLKYDVRVYAYAGKPLFMVARLYSGQTTNFRTDGGGFAEVIVV